MNPKAASNQFLLYSVDGKDPVIVKLLKREADGYLFRRFRIFHGKGPTGFSRKPLRDPTYEGLDEWNQKHAFERLEFCPDEWVRNEKAVFTSDFPVEMEGSALENEYNMHARCHSLKESRLRIRKRLEGEIYRAFRPNALKQTQAAYSKLHSIFMTKGYVQKTSDSPYVAEIMRQVVFNIQSAVILAWDHATKANAITGRSKLDVADAVFEREQHLIDLALKIANNPQSWVGVVELFDTPPPILEFFETHGVKLWSCLTESERQLFSNCVHELKIVLRDPVLCGDKPAEKPKHRRTKDFPVRFRYTREVAYKARIRDVMNAAKTISMQDLASDPFLPKFVLVSPDTRILLETTCRSEPEEAKRADIEQSLVLLNSCVIQHLVVRNIGVDFRRQLLAETVAIEWFLLDGESIDLTLVLCCCDAHILVGSKEELPFVGDSEFLVDKVLFRVERSRVANEIALRRPREETK